MKKKFTKIITALLVAGTLFAQSTAVDATEVFKLNSSVPGYANALDAQRGTNPRSTYRAGNYYLYKRYNGMINISTRAGSPGVWINPMKITSSSASKPTTNKPAVIPPTAKQIISGNTISGNKFTTNRNILGYKNATDAMAGRNSSKTYPVGTYYIFRKYSNGAINISRTQGTPGVWVNPKLGVNQIINPTVKPVQPTQTEKPTQPVQPNKPAQPEKPTQPVKPTQTTDNVVLRKPVNVGDLKRYSDKRFGWSWARPSSESLRILQSNGGIYKYYTNNKEIYLTFDSGYENGNTARILDILKKNNVKVVFFVTGTYIRDNKALIRRMEEEGHIVANHTLKHYSATNSNAWTITKDIKDWENAYKQYMGKTPTTNLYRPATGAFSERTVMGAKSHGYKLVEWSYAYVDWNDRSQPPVKSSRDKLLKNSNPGNVILLHSMSRTNRDLLDGYIKTMKSRGFEFKLVR